MKTATNTSEPQEAAAGVAPRFILVGEPLSTYLQEKFGVVTSDKTDCPTHQSVTR
jgi:hypothetical protein